MNNVSFENYLYFPAIRTRVAELKGFEQLDQDRKRRLLPIFTLGRWPKAPDFHRSAEKVAELMGNLPYLLDLTTDARHLTDHHRELRNPANSFAAWRSLVTTHPQAIPVVQIATDTRARDVTKQAQEIERSVGRLAFRIRDFSNETPFVINALSALDDPRNAVVFIDCQYIRNALAAYIAASVATINQLRAEFPELLICLLSTSFPQSTASFADATQQRGAIEILERELHSRVGGDAVAIYGDHASVHSVVYDDAPIMRWAARIDYPRELNWYFERRPGQQGGDAYISAAQGIVTIDPNLGTRNIWGEEMIKHAAAGEPHAKAPSSWIAVRVNIHIARQLDFSTRLAAGDDELDDETISD